MPPGSSKPVIARVALWILLIAMAVAIDIPVSNWVDRYQPIGTGKKAIGINLIKKVGDFRYVGLVIIPLVILHAARWRAGLTFLVSCAISGVLYSSKWIFGRHRPSFRLEPFTFHPFKDGLPGIAYAQKLSLPSGHACLAFAAASCLAALMPRWRFAFYSVAVIVCIERVLEGAHYPSDVVVGAALGLLSTYLAMRLAAGWFGSDWKTRAAHRSEPASMPPTAQEI